MNRWLIHLERPCAVLQFACSEFQRLICRMDADAGVEPTASPDGALVFSVSPGKFDVDDAELDDAYDIQVRGCRGRIEGSNERSVLLGVYRFFSEAGCLFARPGAGGEIIPAADSAALCVHVHECAAYRHRGLCIEGSNSFEQAAEMIDYLPKIGCNSYFIQFFNPYEFFDRWYRHEDNPYYTPTPVGRQTVAAFLEDYRAEMETRGLIYHGVGHGWTARVLGISADGWYTMPDDALPEDKRRLLARVGGKRGFFSSDPALPGVPLNTNLCYSDPDVREQMAGTIASYCLEHPELTYVHIWLADDRNNQCECPNCIKLRPSDFYLEILNRADELLTERNCPTRLVFLIYQDLLWPPVKTGFRHPERFTLMFAPITRTYTEDYTQARKGHLAPYERNHVALPTSVDDSLAYLDAWKQIFPGDSFLFDYHYMWDHFYDLGNCAIAHTLCKDIGALHALGMNGFISCQITRSQMPTAWGLYAFGRALWSGTTFDEAAEKQRYFRLYYGPEGDGIRTYLEKLSALCHPEFCRGEQRAPAAEIAEDLSRIPSLTAELRHRISGRLSEDPQTFDVKWLLLWLHAWLADAQAAFVLACARADAGEVRRTRAEFFDRIRKTEALCPVGMESREYLRTFRVLFAPDRWKQS